MDNTVQTMKDNSATLIWVFVAIFAIVLFYMLFSVASNCYSVPPEPTTLICTSICGSGSETYQTTNTPTIAAVSRIKPAIGNSPATTTVPVAAPTAPVTAYYTLKDFYIKSAFNCCASGCYKNCNVNLDMLKYVLRQGVRLLDFAIYSIDGEPVVAASSVKNNIKTTFNYIPFLDVLNILDTYAFSSGTVPNSNDPLFINLRIYSESTQMIKRLGNIINQYTHLFLGTQYSFDNQNDINNNFSNVYLSDLAGKICLFVQKTPIIDDDAASTLYEYINMISETDTLYGLKYYYVENTRDVTYLMDHNKQFMTLVYPDTGVDPSNPNYTVCSKYGCQFTCMRYQLNDDSLTEYNQSFNNSGYAFVLKPEKLRWTPIILPDPTVQDPANSFAARQITNGTYKFDI